MNHHKPRRRKKRYKRLAAAVAGAALMSSAMLPVTPPAVAHASRHPVPAPVPAVETAANPETAPAPNPLPKDHRGPREHRDHDRYGRDDNYRNWNDRDRNLDIITTLIAQPVIAQTLAANEQVLFQTSSYDTWSWTEGAYPADMSCGVFVQNPLPAGAASLLPDNILRAVRNVNFANQFVIYAHLGSQVSPGHAISIAKVVQDGNDLTVTVSTNSPKPDIASSPTKRDDIVQLDRATLNFAAPIHITFVDQNGIQLTSYTVNPA